MNDLLTPDEAMTYIGVRPSTFAQLVRAGKLTSQDQQFNRKDLDAYLDSFVLRRFRPDPSLDWHEQRMEQYVAVLVHSEQPENEDEHQRLRNRWYERGEDAVLEAMRNLRKRTGVQFQWTSKENHHA